MKAWKGANHAVFPSPFLDTRRVLRPDDGKAGMGTQEMLDHLFVFLRFG